MEYEIYDKPADVHHTPLSGSASASVLPVSKSSHSHLSHYYGHAVRRLFFAGAVIMLLTLPFFRSQMAVPVPLSIIAILVVTFAAGYTNPRTKWIIVFDVVSASLGLVIFGFQSIVGYGGMKDLLFFTNQILGLVFLSSFYFSVKTLRYRFLEAKDNA